MSLHYYAKLFLAFRSFTASVLQFKTSAKRFICSQYLMQKLHLSFTVTFILSS